MRLPQHVEDLADAARRAGAIGGVEGLDELRAATVRWRRRIERLDSAAGPAYSMRAATSQLVTELRGASAAQQERAVERWVLERARHQARTVARHETIEGYRDSYRQSVEGVEGFIGYRWVLSPNHPKLDVCDIYAEQNLHGLGPGGYPASELPDTPHPLCLCTQVAILDEHAAERELARLEGTPEPPRTWEDDRLVSGEDVLRRMSDAQRRELLGPTRTRLLGDGRSVLTPRGEPIPVHVLLGEPPPQRSLGRPVRALPIVQADRASGQVQRFPALPRAPRATQRAGARRSVLAGVEARPTRSMERFLGAYAGATPEQVDAIATGRATAPNARSPFPPIRVDVSATGQVDLNDGNHRLAAARAAGATRILATVRRYDRRGRYRETTRVIPTR